MNDRFKFRIWDKKLKKLAKWGDNPYHNMEIMNYICVENPVTDWKHEDYILMQCTGLKDKNGKLIYEGDILKGKKDMICSPHSSRMVDRVGVVEIPQNMFVASCRDVKNNCTLFCQFDWVKTEVVGNIYENISLLESEG